MTTPADEYTDKASRAIRRFLIGRPPDLSQDGQFGRHNAIVALLAADFLNGHEQMLKTWDSIRTLDAELTAAVEGRLLRTTDPTQRQCTDLGNAERLVLRYGADLRYCYPWRSWLIWDGTRWRKDERGAISQRAKATVQGLYAEAHDAPTQARREELGKWALRSEAEPRINAMVALAESEAGIPILPEELDRDPWLLNVLNGTIDLRTREGADGQAHQGHRRPRAGAGALVHSCCRDHVDAGKRRIGQARGLCGEAEQNADEEHDRRNWQLRGGIRRQSRLVGGSADGPDAVQRRAPRAEEVRFRLLCRPE
jgi:hypothetical protein